MKIRRAEHSRLSRFGFGAVVLGMTLAGMGLAATPAGAAGNQGECPGGTTPVAKYEWKGNGFVPEFGGDVVSVIGDTDGGEWTSTVPIDFVIVKGANSSKGENVDLNGAMAGTFDGDGLVNPSPDGPAISHVTFCGGGTVEANPGASAVQCAGTGGSPGIIVTLTNTGDADATFVVKQDGVDVGTADELTVTDAENQEAITLPQVEDVATTISVVSGAFNQSFPFSSNCSTPQIFLPPPPEPEPEVTPVDECPEQEGFQTDPNECIAVLPAVIEPPAEPPAEAPTLVLGEVITQAPAELPRTGATTLPLLAVGLSLILFGVGAVLLGRERPALS